MNVEMFFANSGPLACAFGGGYSRRDEQVNFAQRCAWAIEAKAELLGDCPTGTGKSQGYLVPLALSGCDAVISTGTIALQQQLVEKDLPILRQACREAGITPPSVALLKGRANFLCERRFVEYLENGPPLDEAENVAMLDEWRGRPEVRGDKNELDAVPTFWAEVASDAEDCSPKRCAFHDNCFFFRHKAAAEEANILVVNHHLLALNLFTGGSIFDLGERHIVIDEAHKFEAVMMDVFGAHVTRYRVHYVARAVQKKLADEGGAIYAVESAADEFFGQLEEHRTLGDPDVVPAVLLET